jgi:hypothetical protein
MLCARFAHGMHGLQVAATQRYLLDPAAKYPAQGYFSTLWRRSINAGQQ